MSGSPPPERRLMFLRRIRDILIVPNGSVDIIGQDETGEEITVRVGPDDLKLIAKALANRDWGS